MNETRKTYETAKIEDDNTEFSNNLMQMGVSEDGFRSEGEGQEIQVTEEQIIKLRQNKDVNHLFAAIEKAQKRIASNLLKAKNDDELSRMAARITEKVNIAARLVPLHGKCPAGTTLNPATGFCE